MNNKLKKQLNKFFTLLCISLIVVSCSKDDDFDKVEKKQESQALIDFSVSVSTDKQVGDVKPKNVLVTLTNTTNGDKFEKNTAGGGIALFDKLEPGTYNASASLTLSDSEFEKMFGYKADSESVIFSGAAENIEINSQTTQIAIKLSTSKIGQLLIKQIYYAGSNITDGASYRDQFIELYNNSNEVLYADKLLIGVTYGNNSNKVKDYTLSDGQYDWSKSNENTVGKEANNKYVYCKYVFQIPGNGQDYKIEPGKSIVIAATAVNHKAPLVDDKGGKVEDRKGNQYAVTKPQLTVDLSNSDFEVYMQDYLVSIGKRTINLDIQNQNVQDLEIIHFTIGTDLILSVTGTDSFVIFRNEDPKNLPTYSSPKNRGRSKYMQVPTDNIIDAVQVNKEDPTKLVPRQIPAALDGGYAHVPGGKNSSQSIIRKIKKEVNGRKILVDTNNSTEDFTYFLFAKPRGFKK